MSEPIYHVTALYCGEPRLLFAGYASRVAKKLYAGNRKDLAGLTIAADHPDFQGMLHIFDESQLKRR